MSYRFDCTNLWNEAKSRKTKIKSSPKHTTICFTDSKNCTSLEKEPSFIIQVVLLATAWETPDKFEINEKHMKEI